MAKTMTVEEMRAAVAAHDEAYMQPLRDLYASDQWAYVRDTLKELFAQYEPHDALAIPMQSLASIMELTQVTANTTYRAPE